MKLILNWLIKNVPNFFWQVASVSQGFFKHQQRGDPDLTKQEKQNIAAQLLDNRPAVFLQRY